MKRFTVEKSELPQVLKEINERQRRQNVFVNVKVKPYKGLKHPAELDLVTIIIG